MSETDKKITEAATRFIIGPFMGLAIGGNLLLLQSETLAFIMLLFVVFVVYSLSSRSIRDLAGENWKFRLHLIISTCLVSFLPNISSLLIQPTHLGELLGNLIIIPCSAYLAWVLYRFHSPAMLESIGWTITHKGKRFKENY